MQKTPMDRIGPIFDAMQVHRYQYSSGGADYSVTTLLDPPRVVHLNKRYLHKVELFVKDLYHSFAGTAMHEYTERMLKEIKKDGKPKYTLEERLGIDVAGRKVSGAYDIKWNKKLSLWDMKNTSCWKMVFGDPGKHDWHAQQNMYRWLINHHKGELLKELNIIGWFRDWSKANMFRSQDKKYPRYPIQRYKLKLWPLGDTWDYMRQRVKLMKLYEDTADDDLPLCTPEDMWAKSDTFAVKSKKVQRARRVLDTKQEAKQWMADWLTKSTCKDRASDLYIEERLGNRIRCEEWCPVNRWCNQYQDYLKALAKGGTS